MTSFEPETTRTTRQRVQCPTALLDDICALTAMPFPNLLFRVLGKDPERLAACWQRVRPGLLRVGANTLRERLAGHDAETGPHEQDKPHPVQTDHFLDNLTPERRRVVADILNVYDTGNSCNAVLVSLLLRGTPGDLASALVSTRVPNAPPIRGRLPPMMEVEAMSPPARRSMKQLAAIGDPEGGVVPSLFRHLGHDEELLTAMAVTLGDAVTSGKFEQTHQHIIRAINNAVACWPEQVFPVMDADTRSTIEPFARTIPRMLAVSAILRSAP